MVKPRWILLPLIAWWLCGFASAASGSAAGACRLGEPARIHMTHLSTIEAGLGGFNRGLVYFDHACFAEAIAEFNTSKAWLETEKPSRQSRRTLRSLAIAGADLARAGLALATRNRLPALEILQRLIRDDEASQVTLRATYLLASVLDLHNPFWMEIERELKELANLGHWQALQLQARRGFALGRSKEAIHDLERILNRTEDLQQAHALRVLLADAYLAAGRDIEAWLMIRGQDSEAGLEILDASLRIEFLRVAGVVAAERARKGDLPAAEAAKIYEQAWREVQP